jgi:hypothetical protein
MSRAVNVSITRLHALASNVNAGVKMHRLGGVRVHHG